MSLMRCDICEKFVDTLYITSEGWICKLCCCMKPYRDEEKKKDIKQKKQFKKIDFNKKLKDKWKLKLKQDKRCKLYFLKRKGKKILVMRCYDCGKLLKVKKENKGNPVYCKSCKRITRMVKRLFK